MADDVLIQVRQDTASNWTSNDPTLAQGEWGLETDTGLTKLGDGSTGWTSLDYFTAPVRSQDESSTTYTLVIGDKDIVTRYTGASPAVTIPQESSVNFPVGTIIGIRQAGTGTLTVTTTGLTINGTIPTFSQHVESLLRKVGSDTWDVIY